MLVPNAIRKEKIILKLFKTSYVITKQYPGQRIFLMEKYFKTSYVTTKRQAYRADPMGAERFQNIICYYQTSDFKPMVPEKPPNTGFF